MSANQSSPYEKLTGKTCRHFQQPYKQQHNLLVTKVLYSEERFYPMKNIFCPNPGQYIYLCEKVNYVGYNYYLCEVFKH